LQYLLLTYCIPQYNEKENDMQTIVRHRDEGEATWFLNGLVTTKASAAETAGAYALVDTLVTPDASAPPHVHLDEEEAFFLLDGEIEFDIDGTTVLATPGTYALAPRGLPHAFRVLTDTARMLVITSRPGAGAAGGFHPFMTAAGVPATAPVLPEPAAPDPVRLGALAAAHGITILAPEAP
jgi:quercetin dioxygenase-like cupin family protein